MARMTKEERLTKLHAEALAEFDDIQSAMRDERVQCLEDRRFYSITGAQWEGGLGEQFANKPKFEVNKVHLSVMRIINEYRNNRITVDFVSKEGEEYDELADLCDGLYRADEQRSTADEAYDNAFEEAVGGGFGAWRLRAVYEDEYNEDDDHQRIMIEPIYDADTSVFFDLNAKRQDKSDAKSCYVLTSMTRKSYVEKYEDDPTSWPKDIQGTFFDWSTPDVVYIAEYYRVEEKSEMVRVFKGIDGEEEKYTDTDFARDESLEETLIATGAKEVRSKRVKRKQIHKYILSGGRILEDSGIIAGKCIPIIPVYGKRWFVDNVERCMGHVRLAKDAQRLKNMQLSKLGEISAYSTVEKPIFTPEQIAGNEMMWASDNVKNWPYLLINPVTDANGQEVLAGPVGYTKSPAIPPAMAALLQITEQDIQDLLGNQQAGEEMMPNLSGKAVELIQNRLDMQSYIYMSNMAKAIKRCGEVWLSMASDVLVEPGRKMKAVGVQGEIETVELNKPVLNLETGETEYKADLSEAKFDVIVDVGPSSSSRRSATVRSLMSMLQAAPDPETQQVLSAMIMMNIEGEGVTEVRDWFRKKLLKMGVVQPTDDEAEALMMELQSVKPDPQAQLAQSLATEAEAKAVKAQADTEYTIARAEETRAKTAETLAGIDIKAQDQVIKTAQALQKAVQPMRPTTQPPFSG
jgi:hypothetical protein